MLKNNYKVERFLSKHFIKTVSAFAVAIGMSFTGIATEIKVPALWTSDKPVKEHQAEQVGFYKDSDKYIFAIKIKGFAEVAKLSQARISIYLEVDGKKETGRIATGGTDLQMNISIASGNIILINWKDNKENNISLYEDDYLLQMTGDVYYIAIRKEPLKQIGFIDETLGVRFLVTATGCEPIRGAIINRYSIDKSTKVIDPSLDFYGFNSKIDVRQKVREAILINRKDSLKVWNTFGERFLESEPMPPIIAQDSALRIKAARGEKESAIFAISTEFPLERLEISLKSLQNKDKKISQKSFDIKYIDFVLNDRGEKFTDILLPEFNPHKSLHNHIALTVTVPLDATPGIYQGMIEILIDGETVEPIPLELEVYGFALPEKPFMKTAFCIKTQYVNSFFKNNSNVSVPKQVDMLWDLCHEYRFSPRLMLAYPKITLTADEKIKIDWMKFDERAAKYFDYFTFYQQEILQLGSHDDFYRLKFLDKKMKIGDNLFNKIWPQIVKQIYDYHKNAGLLDKTLFVIWDEPYSVWKEINIAAELAKKVAPDIQLGIFLSHYEPAIASNIDVWLSGLDFLRNNQEKIRRIWVYNSNKMGHFNISASDIRSCFWLAAKYGVEGYLYSEINMWGSCDVNDGVQNNNPNYIWMYPDLAGGNPRASLRMIHIRDGIDDYDYLAIYQTLLKKQGENMLKEIEQVFPTLGENKENDRIPLKSNRELLNIRNRLAKEIERLSLYVYEEQH